MLPGGLPAKRLTQDVEREHFADYLPWIAYDPETQRYLTQETALGYIWECTPLAFLSDTLASNLEGLLALEYTEKATIQFILYADDHVQPFTDAFRAQTRRAERVLQEWTERYARFLEEGAAGLSKMANIPTRRFRLFVTLKNGENESELSQDTIEGFVEFLKGAYLHPEPLPPGELLALMRGLFGVPVTNRYDDNLPIRKQILRAEDTVSVGKSSMRLGNRWAKVLSPKLLPEHIDLMKANELLGGVFGVQDDPEQIPEPFLYSVTIVPRDMKTGIVAKAEVMNFQRSAGSFLASLKRRLEEFDWALGMSDKTRFVKIIPSLTVFAPDEEKLRSTAGRVRRIWESKGAVMQEENIIQQIMLLSGLPLGFYNVGKFSSTLDRYFIVPTEVAMRLVPVQGDFAGVWPPRVAYVGRKGQLIALDVMSRLAANHNALIAAGTGAGKSVATQHMLVSHFRSGMKVRVIDIGYSYRKLTRVIGGRFIDLGEGFVLNPFEGIGDDSDLEMAKAVMLAMAYSNQAGVPDEIAHRLVGDAVQWVHEHGLHEQGVTQVRDYLQAQAESGENERSPEIAQAARTLAFTLGDFARGGTYAPYFHGQSTLDMESDDWIVLELERLIGTPQLFHVVVLMIINRVTRALYFAAAGERVPTFILFDEAWKFLRETAGEEQGPVARVIEEGLRRARKYYGSFAIVTQSVRDTARFGAAGDVIRANTQFKFFLMSPDYRQAQDEGLINYDPFSLKLLESVRTPKPRYSEIFIDGGEAFGVGVARLALDPYSYWMFTSDPEDNRRLEQLTHNGMDYAEAIAQMAVREDDA